jgi:hypothetical protein
VRSEDKTARVWDAATGKPMTVRSSRRQQCGAPRSAPTAGACVDLYTDSIDAHAELEWHAIRIDELDRPSDRTSPP